ncbi:MAG TPA: hypothetical protein VKW78_17755 [Terriglobales bacterium]|nr:hypothetical protein [Terriglobales bacterium]
MKWVAVTVFLFAMGVFAQDAIPPGTVLPVELNSSLNSQKAKAGQRITARVMQDIPLSKGRKIPAGTRVSGRVVSVSAAKGRSPGEMTLRFDKLKIGRRELPISTNLRALASMMDVEDVYVPPTGPDRGTPWAWTEHELIGGEMAYGQGGPVTYREHTVGEALFGGVLVSLRAVPGSKCRDEVAGNSEPQATWVFSSGACGLYGYEGLTLAHAGRTDPMGQFTLRSEQGKIEVRGGSGMLLRVSGQ